MFVVVCVQEGPAFQSEGRSEVMTGRPKVTESSVPSREMRMMRRKRWGTSVAQSLVVVVTPSDLVKSILA